MLKTIKQPRVIYIQLLIKKDEMIFTQSFMILDLNLIILLIEIIITDTAG